MCSMRREPRRDDHTTCTAVAPDFVLTVRTYGTGPLYGPTPPRLCGATRQAHRETSPSHSHDQDRNSSTRQNRAPARDLPAEPISAQIP
jgi:hypothetical protein